MLQEFLSKVPPSVLQKTGTLDLNIQSETCNREVSELLSRTVLSGGKRLRPMLTLLMGRLLGVNEDVMLPLGRAIECVHGASLAHDDVVDQANTRRGNPSINALSSNKYAVLAGDYLLADVIVELCKLGNMELVSSMSEVIRELADGEWIQLDAAESKQYSRELIKTIAMKKTASVMSWCCYAPFIYQGRPSEEIRLARSFGENLGVAFQLMDDTLDFSKDSQKDLNLDVDNGIVNAVLFEWLELNLGAKEQYLAGASLGEVFDENQIEQAVEIVRERAFSHLTDAKKNLVSLFALIKEDRDVSEDALIPLEWVINFLGNREF